MRILLKSIHVLYVILCMVFISGLFFFLFQYNHGSDLNYIDRLGFFITIIPIVLFFIVRMALVLSSYAEKYEFYDTIIITIAVSLIIFPSLTSHHWIENSCSKKQEGRIVTTTKLYRNYFFDYFRYSDKKQKENFMTIGDFCLSYNNLISKPTAKNKMETIGKAPVSEIIFNLTYLSFLERAFDFGGNGLSERKAPFIKKMDNL
ncbi:MAG: hypothetical protein ACPGSM_19635 [Thiolinea sp.]